MTVLSLKIEAVSKAAEVLKTVLNFSLTSTYVAGQKHYHYVTKLNMGDQVTVKGQ